jgi:hypothetical protein
MSRHRAVRNRAYSYDDGKWLCVCRSLCARTFVCLQRQPSRDSWCFNRARSGHPHAFWPMATLNLDRTHTDYDDDYGDDYDDEEEDEEAHQYMHPSSR